jgi:pSer/pThr/pTyr-binding forkhead associated (FHA) protein
VILLALRLLLLAAIYGFLSMLVREIRRDWRQEGRSVNPARLIVIRSTASSVRPGETFSIQAQSTIVGRSGEAAVRLDDEHVSSQHAEIYRRGTAWFLRDLGSTNKTLHNDTAVRADVQLQNGDRLEIGLSTLRVEIE